MPKARSKHEKKLASNVVLAGLMLLTIVISLVGIIAVESSITEAPHEAPVAGGQVKLNVLQSPARPTAQVTLYVLPKLG